MQFQPASPLVRPPHWRLIRKWILNFENYIDFVFSLFTFVVLIMLWSEKFAGYFSYKKMCKLLWSILKVTFKTDLSYLLSLVSVSLSLVLSMYSFPVLIFCFYLYLNLCLAREFTYCHIRNVFRLTLSDFSFLQVVVFVVLERTLVLWYLSVASVRRLIYSLTIANLLPC